MAPITMKSLSLLNPLLRVLASETGLEPKEQRLLFQGKEKEDDEWLHMVGVMDMSKVMLFEDPASKERKLEEMKRNQGMLNAYESVARVRAEVDKLSKKVVALETTVRGGKKAADKEFIVLTELLMRQLLNLDAIEADGEARVHRRIEVRRVQSFVDTLDNMKARNCNPFGNASSVSVTTKWETFETGFGSPSAAVPQVSSTKTTQDWELFDSPSFHPIDGSVNIQKESL
ncbi:BAG family molecular chaperone regulator 4-like isoform X2 [Tripterygium wilfordii]|uniref:BAG family molecular chaperone regulator 4-like isoform X2 n=1 Tax=Tripterygium wilfordii TaxID=458696 RepID=UPI0018F7FD26|nr:BAG family molecular chaperone regulator 4-like isoform X2 [Tripterygium wilfordii]